jgi:hypothetical protein
VDLLPHQAFGAAPTRHGGAFSPTARPEAGPYNSWGWRHAGKSGISLFHYRSFFGSRKLRQSYNHPEGTRGQAAPVFRPHQQTKQSIQCETTDAFNDLSRPSRDQASVWLDISARDMPSITAFLESKINKTRQHGFLGGDRTPGRQGRIA